MQDQRFSSEISNLFAMRAREDGDKVPRLIQLGSSRESIIYVQSKAKITIEKLRVDFEYPTKSCAAVLSHFLREAGIDIPITTGAQRLADRLRVNRRWKRISVGQQKAGDVGVCFSHSDDVAGADHIYLVIKSIDGDLMEIADNQVQGQTHQRSASGRGHRTPTEYFLRAPQSPSALAAMKDAPNGEGMPDEITSDVPEPFMDDGSPRLMNQDGKDLFVE